MQYHDTIASSNKKGKQRANASNAEPPTLAGRSIRLPTYIDYSGGAKHGDGLNGSGSEYIDDADDKHSKYRHGWRRRLLQRANTASSGGLGTLLRTAIRAGIFEGRFWRRASLVALIGLTLGLCVFNWMYETHIELAFHSRNWIKRSILPVPPLSGQCFSPAHLASTSYNSSLSNSAKALMLNPGISMRFGVDCYHFSNQLPSIPLEGQTLPERTIFHLYWRADLAPFTARQALLLKSIFATQDVAHSSVVLWTNEASLQKNQLLADILDAVGSSAFSVQVADFASLAIGTPMEGHSLLQAAGTRDKRAWVDGDLLRVLVLYAHGGVWVDMDSVLLRSVRPLLEQEWVTQWDCYDKPYAPLNGAMLSFYKHSPYLCEMLHAMAQAPPRAQTTDWGSLLYHQVHRRLLQGGIKPFAVLPYCLTDSRSCRLDNRLPDPFAKDDGWIRTVKGREELQYKLKSIFAIHLHNQWEKGFPKDGWMQKLVVQDIEQRWAQIVAEAAVAANDALT